MQMLELSNWVCWPESGGWSSQDAYLIGDVLTFLRVRRRIEWEVENGVPPEGYQQEQKTGNNPVLRMDTL